MPRPRESGDPGWGDLRLDSHYVGMSGRETSEQGAMTKQAKSLRKGKFKPSRAPVAKASRAKGSRVKGKPPETRPPRQLRRRGGACARSQARAGLEKRRQDQSRGDARARGPVRGFSAAGRGGAGADFLGLGPPPMDTAWAHASEIAAAVCDGRTSAVAVVRAALARIAKHNRVLNAFTAVTEERALAKAAA